MTEIKPTIKDGLFTPFTALGFLFQHLSLIRFFLIPFAVNIVIFGLGTWAFIHYYNDLLHTLVSDPTVWYQYILYYLTAIALGLVFAAAMIFGFTAVGNIIASPFNDLLSEKTEELRTGKKVDEKLSLKLVAKDAKDAVLNEIKKISVFLMVQILLLLINFLPLVGNVLYLVLSPLSVIYFLVYEYLDFTMSRKRMAFGDKWRLIKENKWAGFGMGLAFFFTTVVPFINFFVMPVAVIGATLLYVRMKEGPVEPLPPDEGQDIPSVDEMVDDVLSNS